jgi:hypothetical protein
MRMEQTECSETSAYKIQTPGNYPEENIEHACEIFLMYAVIATTAHFNGNFDTDSQICIP